MPLLYGYHGRSAAGPAIVGAPALIFPTYVAGTRTIVAVWGTHAFINFTSGAAALDVNFMVLSDRCACGQWAPMLCNPELQKVHDGHCSFLTDHALFRRLPPSYGGVSVPPLSTLQLDFRRGVALLQTGRATRACRPSMA